MGAVLESVVRTNEAGSERRLLVQRVSSSELFLKSPRLRELLLYVAECTLEKRLTEVREQVIAERVFGRKPDLGGQDSIVRAEARNLRKRLELYFQTEGRDEPMTIVMPKGGYSLAFPVRSQELSMKLTDDQAIHAGVVCAPRTDSPGIETNDLLVRRTRSYRFACVGLAIVALATSALAVHFFAQQQHLLRRFEIAQPALPFSGLFDDDHETLVVTSDVGLLQISSLLHRRIGLDEYIARSYPAVAETNPPKLVQNWNIYEFTDGREMTVAGLILRHNAQFAPRVSLRSGHAVQLQDFKEHNVVLIGSAISNPWAQLYEDQLNFPCDLAGNGRILFRNKTPHPKEQNEFPNDDDIQHHRTYARIAFLPRTSGAGATLLLAGTTAQSTQAAGEFVVDQAALSRALRAVGVDPSGAPHFFEVLIRSSNFVDGAISTEVVACRRSSSPER